MGWFKKLKKKITLKGAIKAIAKAAPVIAFIPGVGTAVAGLAIAGAKIASKATKALGKARQASAGIGHALEGTQEAIEEGQLIGAAPPGPATLSAGWFQRNLKWILALAAIFGYFFFVKRHSPTLASRFFMPKKDRRRKKVQPSSEHRASPKKRATVHRKAGKKKRGKHRK